MVADGELRGPRPDCLDDAGPVGHRNQTNRVRGVTESDAVVVVVERRGMQADADLAGSRRHGFGMVRQKKAIEPTLGAEGDCFHVSTHLE